MKKLLILFTLAAVIVLLPSLALGAGAVGEYELLVNGIKVTASSDVMGDGTVLFDSDKYTLTLNNAVLTERCPDDDKYAKFSIMWYSAEKLNLQLIGENTLSYGILFSYGNGCILHVTGEEGASLKILNGNISGEYYYQESGQVLIYSDNSNPPFKGFWMSGIGCSSQVKITGGILEIYTKGDANPVTVWNTRNDALSFPSNAVFYEGDEGLYSVTELTEEMGIDRKLTMHNIKIVCAGEEDNTVVTPVYTLAVANGSGGGRYTAGSIVKITATEAPEGKLFSRWTATAGTLADANSPSTTFTMPDKDATVTAEYVSLKKYSLAVESGSGSGEYYAGEEITITAGNAPKHFEFDKWTAGAGTLKSAASASTIFVMPEGDVTVTATYKELPKYALTVENGEGSGKYYAGDKVTLTAGEAPEHYEFDCWTAASGTFADASSETTVFTMPKGDVTVTATYKELPKYILTVENGEGSGEYYAGEEITLNADSSQEGMLFDKWEADGAELAESGGTAVIIMPENAVTVSAVYKDMIVYAVAFVSGKYSLVYEIACNEDDIQSITVDGNELSGVAESAQNAVRITISSDYVKTLPDGAHELKITLKDGYGKTTFVSPCDFAAEINYTVIIICAAGLIAAAVTVTVIVKRGKK